MILVISGPETTRKQQETDSECPAASVCRLRSKFGIPDYAPTLNVCYFGCRLLIQGCPAPLVCRLLSKATKGSPLLSDDLAAIAGSPPLLAVLVECCGVTDRKTRKRAMQVCDHTSLVYTTLLALCGIGYCRLIAVCAH